jgi:hypothetical protein
MPPGRGLRPDQTRAKNGGSALSVLRTRGGYRVNKDGSISFASEILDDRRGDQLPTPPVRGAESTNK